VLASKLKLSVYLLVLDVAPAYFRCVPFHLQDC